MKKSVKNIVQNPQQDKEKEEFIFPFDSVTVFGGHIDTEKKEALYELINLELEISKYVDGGAELEDWYSREYYLSESLFNMLCEKEKQSNPNFNEKVFAGLEKERIESVLEKAEQIMDKSEYTKNQTRKQAMNYIEYLDKVIKGEIKTNKPNTAAWAFYYFILYKINSPERIEDYPEGKEKAYKKIAKDNEIKSWKNIQTEYLKLHTSPQAKYLTVKKIPTIKKAIEFLRDNPEGMKLAKEYLNIAMENK